MFTQPLTPTPIRRSRTRLAAMILATALFGTACGQGPSPGVVSSAAGPTVVDVGGAGSDASLPVTEGAGTVPDDADHDDTPAIDSADGDVAAETPPADDPATDPPANGTPADEPPSPSRNLDLLDAAIGGDSDIELSVVAEPIALVLEEGGTHVANVLALVGDVAPGSTLTIDFGDGAVEQIGAVNPGQEVRVRHPYEPTLTFDQQTVVATLIEPDGTEFRDRLVFSTRAAFTLSYSPITVRALNDCDTFGKGDFRLTWDNGDGEKRRDFKLGAGDFRIVDAFAHTFGIVFYDEPVPFTLKLEERDPTGAWLFAPWKWDKPFKGVGVPPDGPEGPVGQIGDHAYTTVLSSSVKHGLPGDDDCATVMTFDVTLDMLDD